MRSLIAALLVLAVTPATAAATSQQALRAALPKAQAVAEAHWGHDACTGRVAFVVLSTATLNALRGSDGVSADAAESTCTIRLTLDQPSSRTELCALLVHERGHLHGLRFNNPDDPMHSSDHRDIMAPDGFWWAPMACMRAFVPYEVRRARNRGDKCKPVRSEWSWRCRRAMDDIPAI